MRSNREVPKNGVWFAKFAFALQAAATAIWLLVAVVSIPLVGTTVFELALHDSWYIFLPIYAFCVPVVWNRLR